MTKKPVLLCILDGFGHREATDYNAIYHANTPNWDEISSKYPKSFLDASAEQVGLPAGQMGNSEVGHMNIGSGRIMLQALPRINQAIAADEIATYPEFKDFIAKLKLSNGTCQLCGMLSDGGVHGHIDHLIYLAKLIAAQNIKVQIHAFLDGRDTPPQSGLTYLEKLQQEIADIAQIHLASLSGRFFAMDRDNNWDRVEQAYHAMVNVQANQVSDFVTALKEHYQAGESDEFFKPAVSPTAQPFKAEDGFFMTNFRADRARQILRAILAEDFTEFPRAKLKLAAQLGMNEYASDIDKYLPLLFATELPKNTLADILAAQNLTQLHIAETEKYAHVTFFFNGGSEEPKKGEDRILIPSPAVKTYDLQPEMSAPQVTNELEKALISGKYDFIVVNFANPDMVGHTGVFAAAKDAVEQIDKTLGVLAKTALEQDATMLITADHGNIEYMYDQDKAQPHTAHTLNPVPFVIIKNQVDFSLKNGRLCDIAPTILELMSLPQPQEMTGKSLLSTK